MKSEDYLDSTIVEEPIQSIEKQNYSYSTFTYALAKLFERAAYYGLRAILVLYLIDESIGMAREDALYRFSIFTTVFLISGIIGGLIGDLLLGNRKTLFLGGALQVIGAFVLSVQSLDTIYIGLGLFALGNGLFSPNVFSCFGRIHLNKIKILDAVFSIYYLTLNIGSFVGIVSIGLIGEKYGWSYGFITAGLLMMLSLIFAKISAPPNTINAPRSKYGNVSKRFLIVLIFLILGLYWGLQEFGNERMQEIKMMLSESPNFDGHMGIWPAIESYIMLPTVLILIFLWTFYYTNQFLKIALGFIFGAIAYGLLLFIPEVPLDEHMTLFLFSLVSLSISENLIAPIIYSAITQYANPKYLAILASLISIPTRLVYMLIGYFQSSILQDSIFAVSICTIGLGIISFGLIIFLISGNTKTLKT